jgi:hypothetical protein
VPAPDSLINSISEEEAFRMRPRLPSSKQDKFTDLPKNDDYTDNSNSNGNISSSTDEKTTTTSTRKRKEPSSSSSSSSSSATSLLPPQLRNKLRPNISTEDVTYVLFRVLLCSSFCLLSLSHCFALLRLFQILEHGQKTENRRIRGVLFCSF